MVTRSVIDPWKWSQSYGYSQGVRAGNLLFISGQMPVDDDGKLVGSGDITAQAHRVFANLQTVLKAARLNFDHVVEIISYHVDMKDLSKVADVKSSYIRKDFPAWTAVGVTSLALPGQLLEIRATAVVAD
jgi:reactive intermediate/imine deaminase